MTDPHENVFEVRPIGYVRSEHREPVGVPINAAFAKGVTARIEILPEYAPGLQDIEGFSHLHLLVFLHRSEGYRLITTPFADDQLRGLFTTRSPRRPNPIGLSVVRLIKVEGNILHVEEIDFIDGTPVLDIKPFHPQADHRTQDVRVGWMTDKFAVDKKTGEVIYRDELVPRQSRKKN
ncbi:MAG: tRNA (N6-threonylcarbamoyladenosine(37)-N6)-methyltransferase TrmO [Candidatus Lernaella stagnicola]|nr:tRNA (N6-threonylcarbamoyladenosine(37)-N6)-methyltransferase TrmO [Candidatus Lernaella stagnicola]